MKKRKIEDVLNAFSVSVEKQEEMAIEGEAESIDSLIEKLGLSTEEIEMIRTMVLERARKAWPELRLSYDPNEEFWDIVDTYDKNFRSMNTLKTADGDEWYDIHAYQALYDIPRYFEYMKDEDLEDIDPMEFNEISTFLFHFNTGRNNREKIQRLVDTWVEDQNDLVRKAKDRLNVEELLILIQYDPSTLLKIPVRFIGNPILLRPLTQKFANILFSIRENYIGSTSEKFMRQFETMDFIHEHLDEFEKFKLAGDIVKAFDYVRMFMKTRRKIMDTEFRDALFYAREESDALASAFRRGKERSVPPLVKTPLEIMNLIMQWRIGHSKYDPFTVATIEESEMIKSLLLFKDLAKQYSGFPPIPTLPGMARGDPQSPLRTRTFVNQARLYDSVSRWIGYNSPLKTTTVLMYFLDDTRGYEFFKNGSTTSKPKDYGWPDMFFGNRLGKVIGQAVNDAKTVLQIMSGPDVSEMTLETFENTFKVLRSLASTSKADLLNQLEVSRSFFILGAKYNGFGRPPIKEIYGNSKEEILGKLDTLFNSIVRSAIEGGYSEPPWILYNIHKKNVIDGYGYRLDRIMNALAEIDAIESQIERPKTTIGGSIRKRALYKSISMRAKPLSSKTMSSPKMKSLDWDFFF